MGLRRDEERTGGDRDPVTDVRDDGRGEQPAEAAPEACRDNKFGDSREWARHPRHDTSRRTSARQEPCGEVPVRRLPVSKGLLPGHCATSDVHLMIGP